MVSRDTIVHLVAVTLALLLLLIADYANLLAELGPSIIVFVLFYGIVFGGAHLYLALRGDDGMVPTGARWRYLAMLAVLLGAGVLSLYGGDRTLATIELETIGTVLIVLTLMAYFVSESIAGYRDANPD